MLTKEILQKTLNGLPETFSIDELINQLILLNKVEVGLEQVRKGETFTTEEAKERFKNKCTI